MIFQIDRAEEIVRRLLESPVQSPRLYNGAPELQTILPSVCVASEDGQYSPQPPKDVEGEEIPQHNLDLRDHPDEFDPWNFLLVSETTCSTNTEDVDLPACDGISKGDVSPRERSAHNNVILVNAEQMCLDRCHGCLMAIQ